MATAKVLSEEEVNRMGLRQMGINDPSPTASVLSPEEAQSLGLQPAPQPLSQEVTQQAQKDDIDQPKQKTVIGKIISRFMGSDVDDPLEYERLASIITMGLSGAKAGASVGMVGGPVGAAVGGVVGGTTGAISGAAAPEAILELLESMGLEGARQRGLSPNDLGRVVEGEALLEALFLGTGGIIRSVGRTAGRAVSGVTKEGEELAEEAYQRGVELTPSMVGESPLGDFVLNVFGRFPWVGSKAKESARLADDQITSIFNEAPSRIAPVMAASDLGPRVYKKAKNFFKEVSETFGAQYDDLFVRAESAGVLVDPVKTDLIAREVNKSIQNVRRTRAGQPMPVAGVNAKVKDFIDERVIGIDQMTLKQADDLIAEIDVFIGNAEKGERGQIAKMLSPIRSAIKGDIVENMVGKDADTFAQELAELDNGFTKTLSTIFETATANRIGRVDKRGLGKAAMAPSEAATRTNVDELVGIVTNLNSPQSINELRQIVGTDVFNEVASRTLQNAFDKAAKPTANGATSLNASILKRELGLEGVKSSRAESWKELLKETPFTYDDLKTLTQTIEAISDTPVPNVSTFIARRASIGGGQAIMRGVLPFLALGGGASVAVGPVVSGMIMFGGAKGLVNAISNPVSARALKNVMDKEIDNVRKKQEAARVLRVVINAGKDAGDYTIEQTKELSSAAKEYLDQVFKEEE